MPGGRVSGCYLSIGKPSDTVLVCEGYATGATLYEATGYPVAVAFNAGNLLAAAQSLCEKLPGVRIVVAADDDYRTAGNPGLSKANEAARAVGAMVALPDFGANRPDSATDFNDMARHCGVAAVKRAVAKLRHPDVREPQPAAPGAVVAVLGAGEWPEPQRLTTSEEAEDYPISSLPDGIRQAVVEVVDFVQCPPALAACSALSVLSLAGQGMADMRRADNLEGPVSLYVLAVAESGERKSSCDGHFLRPVKDWEQEEEERTRCEAARQRAVVAAWEERIAGIRARIREAAKRGENCDPMTHELQEVENEDPKPFRVPRLIHTDATPEALAASLASGFPSGGVMSAEAGIVLGGHAMGRDSVMRYLSLLNALWDGVSHRVERRTSGEYKLAGVRLTVGLAAQPETIRQFMESTKGLARGNGFLARFLLAAPQSTQGTRRFRSASTWRCMPSFTRRIREMLSSHAEVGETGALQLPMLTMTTEAAAEWARFHNDVEEELRPGGDLADARDVASKAADNAARLAALFHLHAHGAAGQVSAEHVASAARIVRWHLYQARAFLGEVAAPREMTSARRLDAWLLDHCRKHGVHEVNRRTIQNQGPNALRGSLALDAALRELSEAGRIIEASRERQKLVRVNPALLVGDNGPK